MYVLDLALDKRAASIPTKPVPWGRFEATLLALNMVVTGPGTNRPLGREEQPCYAPAS
jgi:hypothetical protein